MTFIAPNLSIIVGASTAAKLMGMAGGLTNLTKMPSCNILLLGAHRKVLGGFSSTTAMPHAGAIFYSKIVQDCPPVSLFFQIIFYLKSFFLGSSSSCCTFSIM
jgi:U4/U6 small nuclear ribonucleoprotein PRP31